MNIAKLFGLFVRTASAHCDTEDGPAVTDGRRALETGNVNIALKWVHQGDESQVRDAFTRAVAVRDLSPDARDVADRYFLDILIRVHRAGEGAGFDGIKPTGAQVPPRRSSPPTRRCRWAASTRCAGSWMTSGGTSWSAGSTRRWR
jgi:hypothetical protein